VIIVPVFERSPSGQFFNAAVVIDADGSLHAPYHKIHIPQDPKFLKKGIFTPEITMPCILPGMGGSPFSSATTSGFPRRHGALPLTGRRSYSTPRQSGIPARSHHQRGTGRRHGS